MTGRKIQISNARINGKQIVVVKKPRNASQAAAWRKGKNTTKVVRRVV